MMQIPLELAETARRRRRRGHVRCGRPAPAHHAVGGQPARQDARAAARPGAARALEARAADRGRGGGRAPRPPGRPARARRARRARRGRATTGARDASVPLAVNADSLATWFLEPLARLVAAASGRLRPAPRRPGLHRRPARVGHRDGRGHVAGDAGRRMPRAPARRDALRGRGDAGVRRALAAGSGPMPSALAQAPARRLRPSRRPADAVARARGIVDPLARPALRARVERLRRGGPARARLGAAAAVPVAGGAGCRRARAARRSADRRAAVLAAVEPALAAARCDRRRDRRRGPTRARAALRAAALSRR